MDLYSTLRKLSKYDTKIKQGGGNVDFYNKKINYYSNILQNAGVNVPNLKGGDAIDDVEKAIVEQKQKFEAYKEKIQQVINNAKSYNELNKQLKELQTKYDEVVAFSEEQSKQVSTINSRSEKLQQEMGELTEQFNNFFKDFDEQIKESETKQAVPEAVPVTTAPMVVPETE